jgi:hypothetical protein
MRPLLYALCTLMVGCLGSLSAQQISYQISYHASAGNPRTLNQEDDFNASGWTLITPGGLSSNQWSAPVNLPFTFELFGQPFSSCRLSANGLLSFGSGNGGLTLNNTALPNGQLPDYTIACFWEQFTLNPPTSTNDFVLMKTFGTAPNRQCWLRWYSHEWGAANFAYLAVVLEESTGQFHLVDQYSSAALTPVSATVGAQRDGSFAVMEGSTLDLATTGSAPLDNSYYTFVPYEIPPEDLRVISLPGLADEGCSSGPEPLTVRVTNQGQLSSNNFTLGYAIEGQSPVLEAISQTLAPGDTMVHTFSQWPDFSAGGDFALQVWSSSPADTNQLNDTLSRSLSRSLLVDQFPYVEDFENGAGGWRSRGTNSSWELGMPNNSTIQGAASGSQAWITGRSGPYLALEISQVISPCLDFSSLSGEIWLGMQVWWESESPWDGAAVQASLDGGQSWQVLGGVSSHWYNSNNVFSQPGGQLLGWSGSQSQGSGGWREVHTPLPASLLGEPSVRLRVVFASNNAVQNDGFAFDRVVIGPPPTVELGAGGTFCAGVGQVLDAGSGAASYLWSTGDTTQTITLDHAGPGDILDSLVVVTVRNDLGLSRSDSVVFSIAAPIESSVAVQMDARCHDSQDGKIEIDLTGGTAPFTILWNQNLVGDSLTDLSPGWYSATVSDQNGCTGEVDSVLIAAPDPLVIQATISHLLCYQDSSGAISLSPEGGNGGYQWTWNSGDSSAQRSGLSAGSYALTLSDAQGCQLSRSYLVEEPDSLSLTLQAKQDASCPGSQDGRLRLDAQGGTLPYQISWDHGATGAVADSLGVGSYRATLIDEQGCTLSQGPWEVAYQDSAPTAAFGYELEKDIVTLSDSSQGAENYRWQFGDGVESTEPSPQYQYGDTGSFLITLIVTNACGSDTAQANVLVESTDTTQIVPPPVDSTGQDSVVQDTAGQDSTPLSVWTENQLDAWQLFPNPSRGQLTVVLPPRWLGAELRLMDATGRELWRQRLVGEQHHRLRLPSHLPAGLYHLQIRNSQKIYAKPFWLRY